MCACVCVFPVTSHRGFVHQIRRPFSSLEGVFFGWGWGWIEQLNCCGAESLLLLLLLLRKKKRSAILDRKKKRKKEKKTCVIEVYHFSSLTKCFSEWQGALFNPFTAGNPFLGTKLLGFSMSWPKIVEITSFYFWHMDSRSISTRPKNMGFFIRNIAGLFFVRDQISFFGLRRTWHVLTS